MNYVWINEDNMDDFKRVLPCCYGYADCQIDILWLFVPEQVRRKGVATGLMDKLKAPAS